MVIAIVIGTRPEAIKLIPVYLQFKKAGVDVRIISTGQHKEMVDMIFTFFKVKPDVELTVMKHNQSLADLTGILSVNIDKVLKQLSPSCVLVQGDTTTAMVTALVGFYNRIPVGHVEAGLRSHQKDSPFPEEINRKIITQIADFNFAPTQKAAENLSNESCKNVFTVGNTVVDALLLAVSHIQHDEGDLKKKYSEINFDKNLVLITAHRRESFGHSFRNICEALKELAMQYSELEFVFPVHLNPNVQEPVNNYLSDIPNMHLLKPLPYDEMVFFLKQAHLVITDSGGIQEEAPTLNKPVIVLREVTERPEGIDAGCAVLAGTDKLNIIKIFEDIYSNENIYNQMTNAINPYGDGKTSERIVEIIKANLQA